jgi:altronate dehydratase small subunit
MSGETSAPVVFVLMPGDNVGIAGRPLSIDETIAAAGAEVRVKDAVPLGHKIALQAIAPGGKVVRCGVPIGSATRPIAAGEHVHTQNLKSDYIPTFTLDAPVKSEEQPR